MTYVLTKIGGALISPLGTALVLGIISIAVALLARSARTVRRALGVGLLGLVWLWLWSLPVASTWIQQQVEANFPPAAIEALPSAEAIVVLGGALKAPQHNSAFPDMGSAADRVWHSARLYRAGKAPLIVLSGGADQEVSAMSEAAAMRILLRDLGIPDAAMTLEEKSRNTKQNARLTGELLRQKKVRRVLLVTSALHMRRAKILFEAESLVVIPAATDHETEAVGGTQRWLPDTGALDGSARAMKEMVGWLLLQ